MDKENLKKTIEARHILHMNAELSGKEKITKKFLIDFLKNNTRLEIVDRGSWFYAVYFAGENRKNIGFVADFDALAIDESIDIAYKSKNKGVSHKCGHDGHAASLLGLCLEIEKTKAEKIIYFIFQHAEEIGLGGREASVIIKEKNIEEIYKMHNANYHKGFLENTVVISEEISNCASRGITLKFIGKNSHASLPEDGINPSFAIGKLVGKIEEETKTIDHRLILATIVNIEVGDKNFGKNPGLGEISLTVRARKEEDLEEFLEKIIKESEKLANIYKLKVTKEFSDYFPEVYNHKESLEKIKKASKNLSLNIETVDTARSSEDFGYYTKICKGAYFCIGNGLGYPQAHTKEFDYNDNIIESTVEIFKELIRL